MKKHTLLFWFLLLILFSYSCNSPNTSRANKLIVGIWEKVNEDDWGSKIIEFKQDGTIYLNGDSSGYWEIASTISKGKEETYYLIEKLNVWGNQYGEITLLDETHLNILWNRNETRYIRH